MSPCDCPGRPLGTLILAACACHQVTEPMYEFAAALPEMATFTFGYFTVLAVFGGFFLVNLFIAVIFDQVMRSVDFVAAMEKAVEASSCSRRPSVDRELHHQTGIAPTGIPTTATTPPPPPSASSPTSQPESSFSSASVPSVWLPVGVAAAGSTPPSAADDCCGFEDALRPLGYVTAATITLNIGLMCAPYREMTQAYAARLDVLALGCTGYFACEATLKVCVYGRGSPGRGWRQYWYQRDDAR